MLEPTVLLELRNFAKELERLGYDVYVNVESSYYDNLYQTFDFDIRGTCLVNDERKCSLAA